MSDSFDLDALVEASWRAWERDFADVLARVMPGQYVVACLDGGDEAGIVPAILAFPGVDDLRLVVPGNDVLAPAHRLSRSELSRLRQLGLRREAGRGAYRLMLPVERVDEVSCVAMVVLRHVFGVRHPSFLEGGGLAVRGEALARVPMGSSGVVPEGPDHLERLILEALTPIGELAPDRDEDGFLRVQVGPATVSVRSFSCSPTVYLYSTLVRSVADRVSAGSLVALLGQAYPQLSFLVDGDSVLAGAELNAAPFDAGRLQALAEHLVAVVLQHAPDLAARLGGRAFTA